MAEGTEERGTASESNDESQQSAKPTIAVVANRTTGTGSGIELGNAPQMSASRKSPTLSTSCPRRPTKHTSIEWSDEIPGFGSIEVPTSWANKRRQGNNGTPHKISTFAWAPLGRDNFDVMVDGLSQLPGLTLYKLRAQTSKKLAALDEAIFRIKDWDFEDGARGRGASGD